MFLNLLQKTIIVQRGHLTFEFKLGGVLLHSIKSNSVHFLFVCMIFEYVDELLRQIKGVNVNLPAYYVEKRW